MSIYLDASVLVALIGTEEGTPAAIAFVNAAAEPLIVSDYAIGEVSSATSRLVRMKKIEADEARERLAAFDEWVATAADLVATTEREIRLAVQLVRQFALGVRMPDAIHLAATRMHGYRLATLDHRLATNAEELRMNFIVPN